MKPVHDDLTKLKPAIDMADKRAGETGQTGRVARPAGKAGAEDRGRPCRRKRGPGAARRGQNGRGRLAGPRAGDGDHAAPDRPAQGGTSAFWPTSWPPRTRTTPPCKRSPRRSIRSRTRSPRSCPRGWFRRLRVCRYRFRGFPAPARRRALPPAWSMPRPTRRPTCWPSRYPSLPARSASCRPTRRRRPARRRRPERKNRTKKISVLATSPRETSHATAPGEPQRKSRCLVNRRS